MKRIKVTKLYSLFIGIGIACLLLAILCFFIALAGYEELAGRMAAIFVITGNIAIVLLLIVRFFGRDIKFIEFDDVTIRRKR